MYFLRRGTGGCREGVEAFESRSPNDRFVAVKFPPYRGNRVGEVVNLSLKKWRTLGTLGPQ